MNLKKYFKLIGQIILAWLIVQICNILLLYNEKSYLDFSDLKKWEPWVITFFIFLVYQVTSDIRQKNK